MSIVLDATAGGAFSNSYATLAEGNAYHASRLNSTAWTNATSANRTVALVMATRLLDSMYEWAGYPSFFLTQSQALCWPRYPVEDKSRIRYVDSSLIPVELRDATAELARQLLISDRTIEGDVDAQGIKSLKAGSVAIEFKGTPNIKPIPDAVINMIPSWWGVLKTGTGEGFHKLARV